MPPEPSKVICLDVDDALEIFGALIGGSARQASDQLRDRAALAGALARGINYAQYEKAELALQAATPRPRHRGDQPFIDGNKRAALVAITVLRAPVPPRWRRAAADPPGAQSQDATSVADHARGAIEHCNLRAKASPPRPKSAPLKARRSSSSGCMRKPIVLYTKPNAAAVTRSGFRCQSTA